MARRRRHIPPITDDNFHEEWNKFKMDLDASEDDIVYTSFAREQNSLLFLCRIWRLLVIREPPSDSDGETPRRINGVVQSPQHLWDVGCRIYMTAVPDVFRAWRTEAKWRADWRGVLYLGYQGDDADYDHGHEEGLWLSMQPVCLCRRTPFMRSSCHVHVIWVMMLVMLC